MLFGPKEPHPHHEGYDDDIHDRDAASEVSRDRGSTRAQKIAGFTLMGLPVLGIGLWLWFMFRPSGAPAPRANHAAAYQGGGRSLDVGAAATTAAPAPGTGAPPPGDAAPASTKRAPAQLAVRKNNVGADAALRRDEAPAAAQTVAARREEPQQQRRRPWVNRNMGFTIPRNTAVHCLPRSPINSQTRGPIDCMVTKGVWSEDGATELFPFGTMLNGYLGAGMEGANSGSRRLYLAWDEARLPAYMGGTRVPLTGVAASPLGENGVSGVVDTHLWERIRAGVLLTVLQGGVDAAVAAAGSAAGAGSGNTILSFGNRFGGTANSLAAGALQHDYARPNTLRRPQAAGITVKLVDDIDLSEVYQHGLTGAAGR